MAVHLLRAAAAHPLLGGKRLDIVVVAIAALAASALTLFSGFGLGTLLMPVVALFMPVDVAIAVTAVVHLANNVFKAGLLGRHAERSALLGFGLPAVPAAFAGAWVLGRLAGMPPLLAYGAAGRAFEVHPLKVLVGALILVFVLLELWPRFTALAVGSRYMPLGGVVSGFFGGLSGHQGAFRSMFLLKAGLDKQQFVATGVLIAVMVDLSRLSVYGAGMLTRPESVDWPMAVAASLAAFAGAYLGSRLLQKVTIRFVQRVVSLLLVVVAVGLAAGVL